MRSSLFLLALVSAAAESADSLSLLQTRADRFRAPAVARQQAEADSDSGEANETFYMGLPAIRAWLEAAEEKYFGPLPPEEEDEEDEDAEKDAEGKTEKVLAGFNASEEDEEDEHAEKDGEGKTEKVLAGFNASEDFSDNSSATKLANLSADNSSMIKLDKAHKHKRRSAADTVAKAAAEITEVLGEDLAHNSSTATSANMSMQDSSMTKSTNFSANDSSMMKLDKAQANATSEDNADMKANATHDSIVEAKQATKAKSAHADDLSASVLDALKTDLADALSSADKFDETYVFPEVGKNKNERDFSDSEDGSHAAVSKSASTEPTPDVDSPEVNEVMELVKSHEDGFAKSVSQKQNHHGDKAMDTTKTKKSKTGKHTHTDDLSASVQKALEAELADVFASADKVDETQVSDEDGNSTSEFLDGKNGSSAAMSKPASTEPVHDDDSSKLDEVLSLVNSRQDEFAKSVSKKQSHHADKAVDNHKTKKATTGKHTHADDLSASVQKAQDAELADVLSSADKVDETQVSDEDGNSTSEFWDGKNGSSAAMSKPASTEPVHDDDSSKLDEVLTLVNSHEDDFAKSVSKKQGHGAKKRGAALGSDRSHRADQDAEASESAEPSIKASDKNSSSIAAGAEDSVDVQKAASDDDNTQAAAQKSKKRHHVRSSQGGGASEGSVAHAEEEAEATSHSEDESRTDAAQGATTQEVQDAFAELDADFDDVRQADEQLSEADSKKKSQLQRSFEAQFAADKVALKSHYVTPDVAVKAKEITAQAFKDLEVALVNTDLDSATDADADKKAAAVQEVSAEQESSQVFKVGDAVRLRDRGDDEWRPGEVTQVSPLLARAFDEEDGSEWDEVVKDDTATPTEAPAAVPEKLALMQEAAAETAGDTYQVAEYVEVRDSSDEEWQLGEVTELTPLKVRAFTEEDGTEWEQVRKVA